MTVLYNLENGQIIGRHNPYYMVDGKRPELDYPIVELEYIVESKPTYDPKLQKISSQNHLIDLEANEYRIKWTVTNKDAYQLAVEEWAFPQYKKRILAPVDLVLDDMGIKMYGWFQVNELPIEKWTTTYTVQEPDPNNPEQMIDEVYTKKMVRLYCESVLPEHQAILSSFGEVVSVEDFPVPENFN